MSFLFPSVTNHFFDPRYKPVNGQILVPFGQGSHFAGFHFGEIRAEIAA